ncbi:MAG: hypothetical protein HQL57_02310, partial [Magnetococcales bacterium]|nr:hypothetical protein [Magnetococcales bacterium]
MLKRSRKRFLLLTMGCRVNQVESEWIRHQAREGGFEAVEGGESADLVVVNTCSVTAESGRQARQMVRRAVRDHPGARIVVTGCHAHTDPQGLARMVGVDLVLGNDEKTRLLGHLDRLESASFSSLPSPPASGVGGGGGPPPLPPPPWENLPARPPSR